LDTAYHRTTLVWTRVTTRHPRRSVTTRDRAVPSSIMRLPDRTRTTLGDDLLQRTSGNSRRNRAGSRVRAPFIGFPPLPTIACWTILVEHGPAARDPWQSGEGSGPQAHLSAVSGSSFANCIHARFGT